MSGRYEQLGRQLRKARTSLAKHDDRATAVALRRATHLAADLVLEHVEAGDAPAGLAELVNRRLVDPVLAERVASMFASDDDATNALDVAAVTARGRDLDRLLRSLEHGSAMPELAFAALEATEAPAAESRAALTVSGRLVTVAGRGGEGLVFVDHRPVGRPFRMLSAPTSKPTLQRDPGGRTRILWEPEHLVVELGPDFATADVR